MVNKVILVGFLGEDPRVHRGADGKSVVAFTLATNEAWTDRATGEKRKRTEWHRVVIYGEGLAKIAEQYLRKGSQVYLDGKNQTREFTDKTGVVRQVTEVVLPGFGSQLVLLDRANNAAPAPAGEAATGEGPKPDFNDEIPF